MTQLGYQIQNAPDDREKLKKWLEKNDSPLWVSFVPPIGGRSDMGLDPDIDWLKEKVACFSAEKDCCEFITHNRSYRLQKSVYPKDHWGNTANFKEGEIRLVEGCIEVAYQDDHYSSHEFPIDWNLPDEGDFLDWVISNHPELLGVVEETLVASGCANTSTYYTSNKDFSEEAWVKAFDEYRLEYMEDSFDD